jgi:septal ring factor EnvC (AmiA/AmiB activator)
MEEAANKYDAPCVRLYLHECFGLYRYMEVAQKLEMAIEQLKSQKDVLEEDIKNDRLEKQQLEQYMAEVREKIEALQISLADSDVKLNQLIEVISESETGYQKIVTAGQTLMEIVTKNVEKLE